MKKIALIMLVITLFATLTACHANNVESETIAVPADVEIATVSMDVPDMVTIEGETMSMDSYIAGVVAAELQNWFTDETFKAFAVAARTNTVKRLKAGKELINSTTFQCFYSKDDLKEIYGDNWEDYYTKFYMAASSTHNQIVVDGNGKAIDALYHAISSGKTEDSMYVTGYAVSYLKSVDSPWDKNVSDYENIRFISHEEILSYGFNNPKFKVTSYTDSGRPYTYEVCGKEYTATDLMYKLHLKSAVFDVRYEDGGISVTTYGFGHNLGMSAYGANGMAKDGYTYAQILTHYYTNTKLAHYE